MTFNIEIACLHLLISHGNENDLDLEENPEYNTYSVRDFLSLLLSYVIELSRLTHFHCLNYVYAFTYR